jgi:hypothetical protein
VENVECNHNNYEVSYRAYNLELFLQNAQTGVWLGDIGLGIFYYRTHTHDEPTSSYSLKRIEM